MFSFKSKFIIDNIVKEILMLGYWISWKALSGKKTNTDIVFCYHLFNENE